MPVHMEHLADLTHRLLFFEPGFQALRSDFRLFDMPICMRMCLRVKFLVTEMAWQVRTDSGDTEHHHQTTGTNKPASKI